MQELRVCIESHVPDDEIKTAWFTLPIDEKDLWEKLGVDVESDDYRIVETTLPFKADTKENTTIWRLNDLFYTFITLPHCIQEDCERLMEHYASLDLLHYHRNTIHFYEGAVSMIEVARQKMSENNAVNEEIIRYMDLEKFAQYLEETGYFLKSEHGIYELP